jgi:hypothetical protein
MKTILMLLLAAICSLAQSPVGTVTLSTTSSVVGTAGAVVCTLSNTTPTLPSGVHVACTIGGASVLVMDSVVPTGTNGMVGSFGSAGNTVTWLVNQPTGQTSYAWQMAANGVLKTGTF